jgi:hypothetical protein
MKEGGGSTGWNNFASKIKEPTDCRAGLPGGLARYITARGVSPGVKGDTV